VGLRILNSSGIFRDVDEGRMSGIFRDEDDSGESASGTNALLSPPVHFAGGLSPRPIKTVSNKFFLRCMLTTQAMSFITIAERDFVMRVP